MSAGGGPLDLRLVPPAVAGWGAALLVVHAPSTVTRLAPLASAVVVTGLVVVLASAVRQVARRRVGGPCPAPGSRAPTRALPAVVLSVVTAAAVLVSGDAQHGARTPAVLEVAAAQGATVELVGHVASPPRALPGADGRERFTVAVRAVLAAGSWHGVDVPVEVVGPVGAPQDATVRVRGVLSLAADRRGAVLRLRAREPAVVTAAPRAARAWAAQVRAGAQDVADTMPSDVRGLLPAVTVGDTGGVPEDLVVAMRASGLAHVTAVSGAHFAILGALVLAAGAAVRAPVRLRVAAAVAAGAGLLLVVGPAPSVVRAAAMGSVGLGALLAGRRAAGPAALATAVIALLVVDPWLSVEVGFALSVAATTGLVVLGGPLVERWSARCGREVAAVLAAPVAAQLGCLPVTVALWPTFGPWAVLANVAVAPAVAPATVLGLLAAVLAGPWPAAAAVVAGPAGAACWWIAAVSRWAAGLPAAGLAWWPGAAGVVCSLLVAGAATTLVLRPAAPGHGRERPHGVAGDVPTWPSGP